MTAPLHDIVVVSDLHLGRGKNPETGRYYRLEAFFYDDDFLRFCEHLLRDAVIRERGLKFVLNGDAFDLLRIDHKVHRDASSRDKRYGPVQTPQLAAQTMEQILAGHRGFVGGLARILHGGHQVIFTPGNHDPEIQWVEVQQVIRTTLLDRVGELAGENAQEEQSRAESLLTFEKWFHYEPGRIWIEHGCQYDPENSFKYLLRQTVADLPDKVVQAEHDLPLGTFFQKYLYNSFGNITFLVPNSRSNVRYFRWLLVNRPRMLARTAKKQFPFFLQVMRRLAQVAASSTNDLAQCHDRELNELAETSGLGDKLLEIESYKIVEGNAAILVRNTLRQAIKLAGFGFGLALLGACLWFLGFHSINSINAGFVSKALLFTVLNILFLVGVAAGGAYTLLRPPGAAPDPGARPAATKLAKLLDVPMVTFGHTHDESVSKIRHDSDKGSWYFNTGTWIAVFTNDELLPRERVQYTFLRIRDHQGELLHWSPGRGEPTPVVLLEEEHRLEPTRPSPTSAQ